jgi:FkbM family methyltransferase
LKRYIGANVGLFSLLCAKLGAQVLAVEAQAGFISMARENFAMNGVEDRIRLVHAMVGASTGVFACKDCRRSSTQWNGEPLHLSMDYLLDMFLQGRHQRCIHLLKIDIEGSEFALFETNPSWMSHMLHIAMEVHPEFGNVKELLSRTQEAGFTCKLVPSWREKGIPQRYPGFLFAQRNG